jgi:6-phosphofructokinase 1
MVTIERNKGISYSWSLGEASLARVANMEKKMPRSFITKDGFNITQEARKYLQPLINGEDYPPYKNGLPDYVLLRKVMVPKKLADYFDV